MVELESFTARVTSRGVLLRWTTLSEIDNAGFRILRGRGRLGVEPPLFKQREEILDLAPIGPELISPQGTPLSGSSYFYLDEQTSGQGAYVYVLEDTDLDGRITRHGPVRVQLGSLAPHRHRRVGVATPTVDEAGE